MTFDDFEQAIRRMTPPWPDPVPDYIVQTMALNHYAGRTAFFTAGEIRGLMIVNGDDPTHPPTRETGLFDRLVN